MTKYTEIFKLKKMLESAEIPFDFKDESILSFEKYHLEYPTKFVPGNFERVVSVIQGYGTYGAEQNMLEIMGLLTDEESENNSVVGGLSAEDVFQRILKHWKEVQNETEKIY